MTIRVNLHSHSRCSDGEWPPEMLAERLARDGVKFAALTDHDSVEGTGRFGQAARSNGLGAISGIELTVEYPGRKAGEMHLLGYGFDPSHAELTATLQSLRQNRGDEIHSISRSVIKGNPSGSAAPDGILTAADAIGLLHRAGGRAFLAHPLAFEPDLDALARHLVYLKSVGLDGIEALYTDIPPERQDRLRALAEKHNLLISAGTDFHTSASPRAALGVDMPRDPWTQFRRAVGSSSGLPSEAQSRGSRPPSDSPAAGTPDRDFRRRYFILRILLPAALAVGLFLALIWGVILPSFTDTLLQRNRETIHELTNAAWSILASYEADERAGVLTRAEAQERAIAQIEALRYGREGKDYFWLQDMHPRIVMHPYRTDLNGQDVSGFTDPNGVRLFVEFAGLVDRQGEGYLDYVWQWQDDPRRLEPKQSFVKGFQPWGWIIGTGLYLDNVYAEIDRIESRLIYASLLISAAVMALLGFAVLQSLRIERRRREVETGLRLSTERFHALVEATTEGTLLILADRCRYANPTFLRMIGYSLPQLDLLELEDLLPRDADNAEAWERLGTGAGGSLEGALRNAQDQRVECLLMLNPIQFAGQDGWILLAKELASLPAAPALAGEVTEMAEAAAVGLFRARAVRRGTILYANEAARALMPAGETPPALADWFAEPAAYDRFLQQLQAEGEIHDLLLPVEQPGAPTRVLSLTARLSRSGGGRPSGMDGTLTDVTAARKREAERAETVERLQTSLLFLHEPVGRLGHETVTCDVDTPVTDLARRMTAGQANAALVLGGGAGTAIGIVTDHDLRARVLAGGSGMDIPAGAIMTAPVVRIPERALIYEALIRMEENGVQHLAVEDEDGRIIGLVDYKSLIQFQRYGAIVLTRQIARAADADGVARSCGQAPPLIKALVDSGAHPRRVTRVLAGVCDAATQRLIELAVEELGPPPAEYAFLAMGSQGRQEQTLLTDQDNGILYLPPAEADAARAADYFLRLGELVNAGLIRAGFAECLGGVMAGRPKWCRSLEEWKAAFDEWVRMPEPQQLMELSIFFDFRTVYGEAGLAHELRRHIHAGVQAQPGFLPFFARHALDFKPPLRLPGNIYLGGGAEHGGRINLKDAGMPIVAFARLGALRHQISQTHTLDRMEALAERGALSPSGREEITAAYDFLMRLRLTRQLEDIARNRPLGNLVQAGRLGYADQELLQQAFTQIVAVQRRLSQDYLGGAM